MMHVSSIVEAWPIAPVKKTLPLSGGTNNGIWLICTEDEQEYVLRVIPGQQELSHLHYEECLLSGLHEQHLPFALPSLLKTRNDDVAYSFEKDDHTRSLATLSPRLPGDLVDRAPQRHALRLAHNAGAALALLDRALASLPPLDEQGQEARTFGDLAHYHPLVPDPLAAIERLPIHDEQARKLRIQLDSIMASVDDVYARLPRQLLHRDYDPGNVLARDEQVTAVLDFEFAGVDIRILDLCVALSWWPARVMGTGQEWEIIDAFGASYVEQMTLEEEELHAIPDVLRIRDATSLVHRMGRYFAGLETEARMIDRVSHSFWREAWLSTNREKLLSHIQTWKRNRYSGEIA